MAARRGSFRNCQNDTTAKPPGRREPRIPSRTRARRANVGRWCMSPKATARSCELRGRRSAKVPVEEGFHDVEGAEIYDGLFGGIRALP